MPTPRPESRRAASCSASIAAVASKVVLVTMPWWCADRMPALTPGVSPKSSALTMSRRVMGWSPRSGPLDHEPLDRLGDPGRHRRLQIVGADVVEALVPDPRKRLDLARDDHRYQTRGLDLPECGFHAEEGEDGEDQPAARVEMSRRPRDHAVEQLPAVGPAVVGRRRRISPLATRRRRHLRRIRA